MYKNDNVGFLIFRVIFPFCLWIWFHVHSVTRILFGIFWFLGGTGHVYKHDNSGFLTFGVISLSCVWIWFRVRSVTYLVKQDVTKRCIQYWQLWLSYLWSYLPILYFNLISCSLSNLNNLLNILMILGWNVEQDETTRMANLAGLGEHLFVFFFFFFFPSSSSFLTNLFFFFFFFFFLFFPGNRFWHFMQIVCWMKSQIMFLGKMQIVSNAELAQGVVNVKIDDLK